MPAPRTDLHELVDHIPDSELAAARRFLQFLSQEPIGVRFAASIRKGLAEADAGNTIACSGFPEMVEKLLHEE